MNTYRFFFLGIALFLFLALFLFYRNHTTPSSEKTKSVYVGIVIKDDDQLIPYFLKSIENLDYDKRAITLELNLCNNSPSIKKTILEWIENNKPDYNAILYADSSSLVDSKESGLEKNKIFAAIEDHFLHQTTKLSCDLCFIISSDVFVLPNTLKYLSQKDKPIIAPLLEPTPAHTSRLRNFFADSTPEGYYKEHPDYDGIIYRQTLGTYEVPCISMVYLIQSKYLEKLSFTKNFIDWDFLAFCKNARENGVARYICNEEKFGSFLEFGKPMSNEEERSYSFVEKSDSLVTANETENTFDLAKSLKEKKEYDDSIKAYQAHIDKRSSREETWYSMLMIGECYQAKGEWNTALQWFLEAYSYFPERAEPLHNITAYYLCSSKPILGYPFALAASKIPYPENHQPSALAPLHKYEILEDLSIAGNYTPDKTEGFLALTRLILGKDIPKERQALAYRNLLHYVENLKNASYLPIQCEFPKVSPDDYGPFSPSIIKTHEGYKMTCRTVQYLNIEGQRYHMSVNFLLEFDKNLNLLSSKEIREKFPRKVVPGYYPYYGGLDDCRLIHYQGQPIFTCSGCDVVPDKIVMTLCKFTPKSDKDILEIQLPIVLKGHIDAPIEKNWLPFEYEGKLLAIYSYDPFVIYEINTESGECQIFKQYTPSQNLSYFSGSAPPIPYKDGYLMLIHEAFRTVTGGLRYYVHRFVFLDKDLNMTKMSTPFIFEYKGLEYCCGITIAHDKTKLVMSIAKDERAIQFCLIDLKEVDSMLKELTLAHKSKNREVREASEENAKKV